MAPRDDFWVFSARSHMRQLNSPLAEMPLEEASKQMESEPCVFRPDAWYVSLLALSAKGRGSPGPLERKRGLESSCEVDPPLQSDSRASGAVCGDLFGDRCL